MQVIDVSTSKTGKHGHAKCNFTALDIFTNRKYEDMCPSSHNCDVPNITRTEWTLVDISDDGFVSLMNDDTGEPPPTALAPSATGGTADAGAPARPFACARACGDPSADLIARVTEWEPRAAAGRRSQATTCRCTQPGPGGQRPPSTPSTPSPRPFPGRAGDLKDDLSLPEATDELKKLSDDIRAAFDEGKEVRITVLGAMGEEQINAFKMAAGEN